MPDKKGDLYLFEAIELRNEYDRHIKLLENLLESDDSKQERFFAKEKDEAKEPVAAFQPKEMDRTLKNLQTKRVKLNQAIQAANFKHEIQVNGESITIAEALEIRKRMLADLNVEARRLVDSAYKRIIHKEERDIVHEPKQPFAESYDQYLLSLSKLRELVVQIHIMNHRGVVNFREE